MKPGDVLFLSKVAVLNIATHKCLALADSETEAELMLVNSLRGLSPGRIERLGFRIKPVMITVQILPESALIPACAHQGALFN